MHRLPPDQASEIHTRLFIIEKSNDGVTKFSHLFALSIPVFASEILVRSPSFHNSHRLNLSGKPANAPFRIPEIHYPKVVQLNPVGTIIHAICG